MHSFLSRKLRQSFDRQMRASLSSFSKSHDPEYPRLTLYRHDLGGLGSIYVSLEVEKYDNAYSVELSWAPPGVSPLRGRLQTDMADMRGAASRGRPSSSDGRRAYHWNVVTGGEGLRADRPEDDWSPEAMRRSAAAKPDPNMKEHVDECVQDTMRVLIEILPAFTERARMNLADAAK